MLKCKNKKAHKTVYHRHIELVNRHIESECNKRSRK